MTEKQNKRKRNEKYGIVYPGGFVQLENELSLYLILNYSENPDIRVTPMSVGIYKRLRMFKNTNENHRYYGSAWISMERLAVECGVNRKTISKHLHILKNVGLIHMKRFYHSGRRHYEFKFCEMMTETELREKYPKEFAVYEEKLELIGKSTDKDSEYWEK